MDKILVEVYMPSADKSYHVYIPFNSKIHEIINLLGSSLTELSNGYFTALDNTVICHKETGSILDINMSAKELGLQNGSKLMLI